MMTRCNVRFLGVLLGCVPVLMAATEERVDHSFTATPGMTLKVDVDFGAIEVVTNATSQIVVSAYRKVTAGTVAKEKAFLAERPLVMAVVRNGRFAFLDRDRKLAAASDGSQP